ncbi:unnamed protein product [Microthlaspi erraticum]|uniref:Uncharacterized protein n=1 Tax=Microthlaspi erraticum TaxID=1685480 RepID=A0A6D2LE67_9BRAS|nr:unnamed protein product [Microthlaspi erraticum]
MMLNAATKIDELQTSADAEIKMTTPRRTRLHHSLTKMICLRRRNGKSDKHLGIKPVSSTRPRKRTTNGLIPAWVRRQPFQRYTSTFWPNLSTTPISSSHEIERSRHHTSPRKPTGFVKHDPEKTVAEARPQPVSSKHDPEKTSVAEARPQPVSSNTIPRKHRSRHHIRNRAVSSSHEPDKTPISSSYTKSSGLVITRAREDTDLVIIYEIERSRHHTSPIKPISSKLESEKNRHSNLFSLTRQKRFFHIKVLTRQYGSKVNNATQHHVSAASRQHRHRVGIT